MKKVLILTYYFHPCGLTSANRTYSWAKYLTKYGYYPIIITRSWSENIKKEIDLYKSAGDKVEIKKFNNYEVHYVPYRQSIKDKILVKNGGEKKVFWRKMFSFLEQFSQFSFGFFDPYRKIYKYAENYLYNNHKDIDNLIVSADPFVLFKYGNKLSNKYNLKWIADYRDDWTTTDWERPSGFLNILMFNLEKKKEQRWVSSASVVTSVSQLYTKKISEYTKVKGEVIINGFFHEEFVNYSNINYFDIFTITYVGLLYEEQKVELFIDGFKKFLNSKKEKIKIRLLFAGLGFKKEQKKRIIDITKDIKENVEITNWLSRKEAIDIIFQSHVLLHVAAENIKGVPSSTVYESVASNKPILLCPTDYDEMELMVKKANKSFICEKTEDIISNLNHLWEYYESSLTSKNEFNQQTFIYSREYQTKLLSDILKMM